MRTLADLIEQADVSPADAERQQVDDESGDGQSATEVTADTTKGEPMTYLSAAMDAEIQALSDRDRELFDAEWNRRAKSGSSAWICAVVGLHYAYLGRWGLLIVYWLTWGGLGVWWFVDLFRVPGLVRDRNADEAMAALRDVRAVRAAR